MDRDIVVPKEVYIKLERPTDGDNSDPIKFTYKPTDSLLREFFLFKKDYLILFPINFASYNI